MKTNKLSKSLIILFVFLSVNSEATEENDLSLRAIRRHRHKKTQSKIRPTIGKAIKRVVEREYPMAPTAEELNGEKDEWSSPGQSNSPLVIPISADGSIPQSDGSPYAQSQGDNQGAAKPESNPFDLFSSFLDPSFIQMFTDIMTKLVTNLLPMFGDGLSFAKGMYSTLQAMSVPKEVCNGVAGQCPRYFQEMKSDPNTIRPIMSRVLGETLEGLKSKYGNSLNKSQRPRKQVKQGNKAPQKKQKQHGHL